MNYPTDFTLQVVRSGTFHSAIQICARSPEDKDIYSVIAEIKDFNVCEEHGTAKQWALVITSLIRNASKEGILNKVLDLTKTELEKEQK